MFVKLFTILLICPLSFALFSDYWYSGNLKSAQTPQAFPVDVDVSASFDCQLSTSNTSGYRNFTITVTKAGFYYFTALFDFPFLETAQIQVYNSSFNPIDPCQNHIISRKRDIIYGSPHIEFVQYFVEGFYSVVVTGSESEQVGLFVVHVDPMISNAVSEANNPYWWFSPLPNRTSCIDSTNAVPYTKLSWTQYVDSTVDILLFGYDLDEVYFIDFSAVMYNTSSPSFINTGNSSYPTSGCRTNNFMYQLSTLYGDYPISLQNSFYYAATAAVGIKVKNGQSYSIVIGSDRTVSRVAFGLLVRPTLQRKLEDIGFNGPQVPGFGTITSCFPSALVNYTAHSFVATSDVYIFDNEENSFDSLGCLYQGKNDGKPPLGCPPFGSNISLIECGDTGHGAPIGYVLEPGTRYTWIDFAYLENAQVNISFIFYMYYGKTLDYVPISTTGSLQSSISTSDPPEENRNDTAVYAAVGASASVVVIIVAVFVAVLFIRRNKKRDSVSNELSVLNFADISNSATDYVRIASQQTERISSSKTQEDENIAWDINPSEVKIQKQIGKGAFGVVYQASFRKITVAVKQVSNESEKSSQDFIAEASVMKKLRPHKNVIQLYGIIKQPLSLVTEYAEKGSLLVLLRSGEEIREGIRDKIIIGIARGMLHLHMEFIAHRDLAARNVLLDQNFDAKIGDFGLSRQQVTNEASKTIANVGPLKWLPPEWLQSRNYSLKSDVWSFGIVLIEIITRQAPYPTMDALAVAMEVGQKKLRPSAPEGCPEYIAKLIDTCCQFDPNDRPSFSQICEDIERDAV